MSIPFSAKALFFIIFFQIIYFGKTFAQLDSLIEVVETLVEGEEKARTYLDIAFYLHNSDPDESLLYCQKGLDLSNKLGFDFGIGKAYYIQGAVYSVIGENQKTIAYADTAAIYMGKTEKPGRVSSCLNLKANAYMDMGLYEKSAEILLEVLTINEKEDDEIGMAYTNQSLGTVFVNFYDNESARKYYLKSIAIFKKKQETFELANTYILLSISITDFEERWKYLDLGLKNAKAADNYYLFCLAYLNIGAYRYDQKKYQAAIDETHKALFYAKEIELAKQMTTAYINLGDYKRFVNEPDSAIYYLEKGVNAAREYQFSKELEESYLYLSELYNSKGNYKQALDYATVAYVLHDSLYSDNLNQQVQINAAKFEFEKNERKIAQQQLEIAQSENVRNQILIIAVILIALIAGFYQWYLYKQRQKKQAAEAETERLKELDELKVNFFTNLAHELRTPLTLILSPLSDVIETIKSKTEKGKLQTVQRNAKRLMTLVNEIMDVSKAEVGKMELHLSNVLLTDFLKRVFYAFESLASLRKIDFQLSMDLNPDLRVKLDSEKTEKIINNLLTNALKYTNAGGQVSMAVTSVGQQLKIEVKDNGQGIHADDQPYIFNRFYQAKHGRSNLQGGTGVGLALSKELAKNLGGDIAFTSLLNEGSVFVFQFPVEILTSKQEVQLIDLTPGKESIFVPTYQPIIINGEKPNILVVEDNLEMSKYLVEILSNDFHCTTAMDGEEALKQLQKNKYDCITSDVMMPNMDGFTLRSHVNEHQEWRQIPFLLLTARYMEEDKIKGFQLGIDDYITKPFSTRELQARIHNLISNKLERDAFIKNETTPEEEDTRLTADQKLLKQVEQAVLDNLDNYDFTVDDLSKEVGYSSPHLRRLIKKLTGFTMVAFILEIRLQKARTLLEKGLCATVTEAQLEVGVNSLPYFTRKFTQRFGVNPNKIRKTNE